MKVTQLWMRRTGTYRPIFSRPYQMSAVSETDITLLADLHNATQGGTQTDSNTLAGIANRIVAPSATQANAIPIANGLDTPRFYLFMECEVQVTPTSRSLMLFSGYTDYDGITPNGVIDPNMRIYFNNQIKLREIRTVTGRGYNNLITNAGSNQILTNTGYGDTAGTMITMRPEDVFSNAAFLETNHQPMSGAIDMRYSWNQAIKVNDRANNHPSQYLAKVLTAQASAENSADYTGTDANMHSLARGYVTERAMSNDTVLAEMAQYSDLLQYGFVTWGALAAMPGNTNLEDRVEVFFPKPTDHLFNHTNTHDWHGADKETMSAYYMATLLPPIMMRYSMTSWTFSITNDTPGGRVLLQPGMYNGYRGMDLTTQIPTVMQDVINSVFNIISDDGQTLVSMQIACDVFEDIVVHVSVNGGPVTVHTLPCFCDSAGAPVISNNMNALNSLSTGLTQTLGYAKYGTQYNEPVVQNPFDLNPGQFVSNPPTWSNETVNQIPQFNGPY
jgi:hypothetical protein